ncbi:MAG: CatA-like O-acetyltransferase [Methanobrevibacter sp.]|uniref:CatA-like O-acetyltransferase n=1 Tax=Methanobrevibacter sp. TaxID=66852 RepID=UPI0026E0348B|nr:CatA-like O-acetyltransferase [Methanobrevibacter sp.]MDO5849517.1 CatA-like O-acetyltransferase [Methanobrevibacter sp.]
MKKIDFNLESNPFINFQSARYCMSARVNAEKTYNFSKENGYSFFLISLGCILKAANMVPQLKRRIIEGEAIEYDYLDGVTPIMDEDNEIYREMRVVPPMGFDSVKEWHDQIKQLENDILSCKNPGFEIEMEKRDLENIVNCSCIPWVDFDSITNCVVDGLATQPLITWGKFNENSEFTVSITVSHIFVNGRELGYFYQYLQESLDHPEDIICAIQ